MIITVTLNPSVDKTVEVPSFSVGEVLKGRVVRIQPAGKGVNISRCLATLGVRSVVSGFVGSGEEPLFVESFDGQDVGVELVAIDGRTRSNTTILDPVNGSETHIREEGPRVTPSDLARLTEKLEGLAGCDDLVVFAGSLPPGADPSALGELVQGCQERGSKVGIDTSGEALREGVVRAPFLIKPNEEELRELLGRGLESEEELLAGAAEVARKVEIVLLSRGEKGAVCVTRDERWGCRVEVGGARNTVGCGDALLAGFLAAFVGGQGLSECLRSGVAAGGACALSHAAGLIDPDEVARLSQAATEQRLSL